VNFCFILESGATLE